MAERNKEADINKVEAQEHRLRDIYQKAYMALKDVDRSKYKPEILARLDSALDPPGAISFDKVVAVLKAILGSQPTDKIQIEDFYGALAEGDKSVGRIVHDELREIGLSYKELYTFVHERGWAEHS